MPNAEPTMDDLPFSVTLELEQRKTELWGKLTFEADEPYQVEQYNVLATGAGYFRVLPDGGDVELPYEGPWGKPDANARVKLKPEKPVTREVRLDDRYPFAADKQTYTVQYVATHFAKPHLVPLRSNAVEVEYGVSEPTTD